MKPTVWKKDFNRMAMSPNSLQQTKEQNFQIYLVMKDFIINAGKVLINLPKAAAQQSFL